MPRASVVNAEACGRLRIALNASGARWAKRLPVVLTVDEVSRVMSHLTGDKWLVAMLLYGGGLRLLEALPDER